MFLKINGKKLKRYDIIYVNDEYVGILDYCHKRMGWAIKEFEIVNGKFEEFLCHCYQCSGHFEIFDLELEKIKIKGNIKDKKKYGSKY